MIGTVLYFQKNGKKNSSSQVVSKFPPPPATQNNSILFAKKKFKKNLYLASFLARVMYKSYGISASIKTGFTSFSNISLDLPGPLFGFKTINSLLPVEEEKVTEIKTTVTSEI